MKLASLWLCYYSSLLDWESVFWRGANGTAKCIGTQRLPITLPPQNTYWAGLSYKGGLWNSVIKLQPSQVRLKFSLGKSKVQDMRLLPQRAASGLKGRQTRLLARQPSMAYAAAAQPPFRFQIGKVANKEEHRACLLWAGPAQRNLLEAAARTPQAIYGCRTQVACWWAACHNKDT